VRESSSYTADEAKREGAVELVATSASDFLGKLEGRRLDFSDRKVTLSIRGATIVEVPMSPTNRVLDAIADPTVASLLVTIGLLGVLYELSAPGIGLGGIVGVVALLLGLLAMSVLPVRFAGFAMIAAGFAAVGLEVKAPTHGFLGFGGLASVLFGAVILVDEGRYFGAVQSVDLRILGPAVVLLGAGFLALATLAARALRAPPLSGLESLRGARGKVRDALVASDDGFSGTVFVDGARWRAVSKSAIEAGATIEVVKVLFRPTRFEVKLVTNGEV
jgi:membrane-bound serine protease (ClpP class)